MVAFALGMALMSVAPLHRPADLIARQAWVAAKFGGPAPEPAVGLEILANHGPVQVDRRGGGPLRIGARTYPRGLYCHAPSRLVARLPGPGERFTATAGVDSNPDTLGGRGSVVFGVTVGATAWRSSVVREGAPPLAVDVALDGATAFELTVDDGGDGIACDQADWADAVVTLRDGRRLALGAMELSDRSHEPDGAPPFSFVYGGRPSAELLPRWKLTRRSEPIDGGRRRRHTSVWRDPETGLEVAVEAIEYLDYPTVEWLARLRQTGAADTPPITALRPLDVSFERHAGGEFTAHRIRGDDCTPRSYEPLRDELPPGATLGLASVGGRPTNGAFPAVNLTAPGAGWIVVLGWPGQWAMGLERDAGVGLRVWGGQETCELVLHPGEAVRTPLAVLQFHDGDRLRAQNVWRRWMVDWNLPRPGGRRVEPRRSLCCGNYYPGLMTVGAVELEFLQRHLAAGVGFDAWWQDAGWYPCDGVGWPKTGTWRVDPGRFPGGLRPLSEAMRAAGRRTMVWFEPERVHPGTELADEHPEWVHGGRGGGLLKLGDPACRAWLTERISGLMASEGIDDYRQDFNLDPLPYWLAADEPGRRGMTEIRHVEGYLAHLDELARRHPEAMMDSCASGGRRNDLETLRRMVPLLRSDWYNSPEGQQGLTHGLSQWIPYHGTGVIYGPDAYWWRSSMVAELSFGPGGAGLEGVDLELVGRMVAEHRAIAPYFLGDFWPLTPYDAGDGVWMAWQFHRPDLDAGVVQVFRRPEAIYDSARLPLNGLDAAATYRLENLVDGATRELRGAELREPGLAVSFSARPAAAVWHYRRAGTGPDRPRARARR